MSEWRRYARCMPLASGVMPAGQTILPLLGCVGMGDVDFAQQTRAPRHKTLGISSTDVPANDAYRRRFIGEASAITAAIASAFDYAQHRRALIPNSCVRSGRAGPAGNYTRGVDHYPKLVR